MRTISALRGVIERGRSPPASPGAGGGRVFRCARPPPACQLYGDLIEHWETRHLEALERLDPKNLDRDLLIELVSSYVSPEVLDALRKEGSVLDDATPANAIDPVDDFAACEIVRARDFVDRFAKPFYHGCEAEARAVLDGRRARPRSRVAS
jgi:hypothetical protein